MDIIVLPHYPCQMVSQDTPYQRQTLCNSCFSTQFSPTGSVWSIFIFLSCVPAPHISTVFSAGIMQQPMQLCCAVTLGAAAACRGQGLKKPDYFPVPVHSAAKQTIVPGELAETRWLTSPLLLLHDMNFLLFPSTHPSSPTYCCV